MALLYRFVKVHDRGNTRVFSFVVTKTVTRDLHRDVTTKEFPYGFHRWAVTFSRNEKLLGVYLVWRNPSEHVRLYIDFAFSLLNREHFSGNESFSGKQIKFSKDSPAQGNRKFINVGSLYERKFTDTNGEFQLELTMTNIRTVFETELVIERPLPVPPALPLETSFFTFGNFEWSVAVHRTSDDPKRLSAALRRLTGFEHKCRVRYSLALGSGDPAADSGILEDVNDRQGRGPSWVPTVSVTELCPSRAGASRLKVVCEMLSASTVSELAVATQTTPATASCHDRDRQAWSVEADTNGDFLRLKVVYKDIHNIPRNHIKHASWNVYLTRRHPKGGYMSPSLVQRGPFCNYYVHEEQDEGIMVETDVPVKELRSPGSLYVDERHQLLVQLEWLESVLLFQSTYHKYDDISRVHNFQMRREISALQAENYSLERQLFSYQKSIAFANSRGTYSDELPSPESHTASYTHPPGYPEPHPSGYPEPHPSGYPEPHPSGYPEPARVTYPDTPLGGKNGIQHSSHDYPAYDDGDYNA